MQNITALKGQLGHISFTKGVFLLEVKSAELVWRENIWIWSLEKKLLANLGLVVLYATWGRVLSLSYPISSAQLSSN